jgi:hypothetical protein
MLNEARIYVNTTKAPAIAGCMKYYRKLAFIIIAFYNAFDEE